MEQWSDVVEFPGYSVSDLGRVRNDDTGRLLVLTQTQSGLRFVGMNRGSRQYSRSVALLVARTFLPAHENPRFDCPINVDGDRTNCKAANLMWRTKSFASKYHRQFARPPRGIRVPVMEMETRAIFPNSWTAALEYGLLQDDLTVAIMNRTYVLPTYQVFHTVEEE